MARRRARDEEPAPAARRSLALCPSCPGPGDDACGISLQCPNEESEVRLETPEEVHHRRRGERLAALLLRHQDVIRPILVQMLGDDYLKAEEVGELIGEILQQRGERR
jgi:hypothetical protein